MLGLWEESVDTLVLTLSAVLLAVLIGVPLGVLAARVPAVGAVLRPVLDVMQILPTFAYLAPMTLLFLIGSPAATIATLIFAIPPAIRITALGISEVSEDHGRGRHRAGLHPLAAARKVRLPMARPTIVLAVNQAIMMALSMVVMTALIDAPGLGENIVFALERVNVGAAFDAGLAIVVLAVDPGPGHHPRGAAGGADHARIVRLRACRSRRWSCAVVTVLGRLRAGRGVPRRLAVLVRRAGQRR